MMLAVAGATTILSAQSAKVMCGIGSVSVNRELWTLLWVIVLKFNGDTNWVAESVRMVFTLQPPLVRRLAKSIAL
jgi:hypothetical protein